MPARQASCPALDDDSRLRRIERWRWSAHGCACRGIHAAGRELALAPLARSTPTDPSPPFLGPFCTWPSSRLDIERYRLVRIDIHENLQMAHRPASHLASKEGRIRCARSRNATLASYQCPRPEGHRAELPSSVLSRARRGPKPPGDSAGAGIVARTSRPSVYDSATSVVDRPDWLISKGAEPPDRGAACRPSWHGRCGKQAKFT